MMIIKEKVFNSLIKIFFYSYCIDFRIKLKQQNKVDSSKQKDLEIKFIKYFYWKNKIGKKEIANNILKVQKPDLFKKF